MESEGFVDGIEDKDGIDDNDGCKEGILEMHGFMDGINVGTWELDGLIDGANDGRADGDSGQSMSICCDPMTVASVAPFKENLTSNNAFSARLLESSIVILLSMKME